MFILLLVRFGLLSGHLLEKKTLLTRLTILCSLCILTISRFSYFMFGSGCLIWVLIAPVPDLCILVAYKISQ